MKNTSKPLKKSPKMGHFFTSQRLRLVSTFFTLFTMLGTTNSLIAQKFSGVELNQNYQIVINQFIAKGWVQTQKEAQYTSLKGKILNEEVSLTIYATLTSRKVRKIVLFYLSETSWNGALSLYNQKVETITAKYGKQSNIYEDFYDPYYLGDGYELQALDHDKCQWIRIWADMAEYPNLNVAVEIGKSAMVMVTYEIISNMELHQNELKTAQQDVY
jgi:hypothetical protein